MRVFLSWSEARSKHLAESLHAWLPRVVQSLTPWMSNEDIGPGSRWPLELGRQLQSSDAGLIVITPENMHNAWLLFEAGALSRSLDSSVVCPILFDLEPTDLTGPLAQFQCLRFTKDDMTKLLQTLNLRLQSGPLPTNSLLEALDVWWPQLEVRLAAVPTVVKLDATPRSPADMMMEMLNLTRELIRRQNVVEALSMKYQQTMDALIPSSEQLELIQKMNRFSWESMVQRIESMPDTPENQPAKEMLRRIQENTPDDPARRVALLTQYSHDRTAFSQQFLEEDGPVQGDSR